MKTSIAYIFNNRGSDGEFTLGFDKYYYFENTLYIYGRHGIIPHRLFEASENEVIERLCTYYSTIGRRRPWKIES